MENNGFGYGQGYNATPPMPYPMMPYNSMNTQEMAQFLHAASTRMPTMPPHPYHGMPPAMISATKPKSQLPRQQRWSETEVRTFLNRSWVVSVVTRVKVTVFDSHLRFNHAYRTRDSSPSFQSFSNPIKRIKKK
jgi:hypothetical protein